MAVVISYETLFELLRKEQSREDLQSLPQSFFADVLQFMREKQDTTGASSASSHRAEIEFRNIKKVLKELYERRERKILLLALNKARTESAIIDPSILLPEERVLFDQLVLAFTENKRDVLDKVLSLQEPAVKTPNLPESQKQESEENDLLPTLKKTKGFQDARKHRLLSVKDGASPGEEVVQKRIVRPEGRSSVSENEEGPRESGTMSKAPPTQNPAPQQTQESFVKLRFLKDVPKFLGHNKAVLGPFTAGAETELDSRIAGILLKKGLAKEV